MLDFDEASCLDRAQITEAVNAATGVSDVANVFADWLIDTLDTNKNKCVSLDEAKEGAEGTEHAARILGQLRQRSLHSTNGRALNGDEFEAACKAVETVEVMNGQQCAFEYDEE